MRLEVVTTFPVRASSSVRPQQCDEARAAEDRRLVREERRIAGWAEAIARTLHYTSGPPQFLLDSHPRGQLEFPDIERLVEAIPRSAQHPEHEAPYLCVKAILHLGRILGRHGFQASNYIPFVRQLLMCSFLWETSGRSRRDWLLLPFYHYCRGTSALPALRPPLAEQVSKFVKLLEESAPCYRRESGAYREIAIAESAARSLPIGFHGCPMPFIETAPIIRRGLSSGRSGRRLRWEASSAAWGYDWTRVRVLRGLVFKRVDFGNVQSATAEIDEARRMERALRSSCLPLRVQRFVGYVYDQGNAYVVSEHVPHSVNLHDRDGYGAVLDDLRKQLGRQHGDIEARNVVVQYATARRRRGEEIAFWLLDFERTGRAPRSGSAR